ncbi:MAG: preprotein translocase subunit YajC [Gallionellaceae bacterium]|nr:preprotein translocase subunit YajC [Gallionellaceae bacterium]
MRLFDLTSWQGLLSTLLGILFITLIGVGVRLLVMLRIQRRQQRENRQINERLRTLMAAYKVLGGSFTGDLAISPAHKRDLPESADDRARRMRDAVEAALSDIILLGTEEQVRLAVRAANDMVAGQPIHTDELVVSLRDFIRDALELEPVPADAQIPKQGPTRVQSGAAGRGARESGGGSGEGRGGGGAGAGMGMMGVGIAGGAHVRGDARD